MIRNVVVFLIVSNSPLTSRTFRVHWMVCGNENEDSSVVAESKEFSSVLSHFQALLSTDIRNA